MKKIAFLSCGMLRTFEHCVKSWNIFDSCDIFVYTWDKTSRPFTKHLSIPNFSILEEVKKNKIICDYEILCDNYDIPHHLKNPYLWAYAEKYVSWDYDYIFISRPDIVLEKTNKITYPESGEISLLWYNDEIASSQDLALFMRRDDLVKFSQCYQHIKNLSEDIHANLYWFIKENFKMTNSLGNFIRVSLNRPYVNNEIFDFDYVFQQEIMFWESSLHVEHAICKINKRIAILLVSKKNNTINDRNLIMKNKGILNPFFFESETEEMARDKCCKYEEVTGLKFDEIMVEHI